MVCISVLEIEIFPLLVIYIPVVLLEKSDYAKTINATKNKKEENKQDMDPSSPENSHEVNQQIQSKEFETADSVRAFAIKKKMFSRLDRVQTSANSATTMNSGASSPRFGVRLSGWNSAKIDSVEGTSSPTTTRPRFS